MSGHPAFLTLEQVEAIHRLALDLYGGQDGVRDPSGLESAVMHPLNVWFYGQGDLFDVAAAYAFHIAQSQAFLDGNKRTAVGAALTFLEGSGVEIPEATDAIYDVLIGIAERRLEKSHLAALFRHLAN
ncbi:MAG: type II toxin-antitoxin system death-on-curing family toxin [Limisphaerales bacterium]